MSCSRPIGKCTDVTIYARISSKNQRDGLSLDAQVEKCKNAAQANNLNVVGIVMETASGFKVNRTREHSFSWKRRMSPFQELCVMDRQKRLYDLLHTARRGSIIMTASPDRLCRNVAKFSIYREYATKKGFAIICLSGTEEKPTVLATSLEEDEKAFDEAILSAQEESEKISARIRSSHRAITSLVRQKRPKARPYFGGLVPYGKMIEVLDFPQRPSGVKILVDHPDESDVVRRIVKDYPSWGSKHLAFQINADGYRYKGSEFTQKIVAQIFKSARDNIDDDLDKLAAGMKNMGLNNKINRAVGRR